MNVLSVPTHPGSGNVLPMGIFRGDVHMYIWGYIGVWVRIIPAPLWDGVGVGDHL